MGKIAVILALSVASLAYILYVPLPVGWRDERELRITSIFLTNVFRFTDNYVLNAITKFMGHDKWFLFRLVMESSKLKSVEGILITNETWNGIRVLIFTPIELKEESKRRPGVIFFHGGGWTLMKPDVYASICGAISKEINAVVIAPDFRNAPKHSFPAGYEDCLMVAKYFISNAYLYGVDNNKIALAGDSSGANFAAATSLELQEKIHSQYLLYPTMQLTHYHLPSLISHRYCPMLSESLINRLKMSYLGFDENERMASILLNHGHLYLNGKLDKELYDHVDIEKIPIRYRKESHFQDSFQEQGIQASKELTELERNTLKRILLDPRLSPLAASNDLLSKTPKTYIVTCDCDVLRDEGILYAEKLKSLHVDVKHVNVMQAPHGSVTFKGYFSFIKQDYLDEMKKNLDE